MTKAKELRDYFSLDKKTFQSNVNANINVDSEEPYQEI